LLVEIPHICIHKKDYLNNEYIEKRAIYLCYLAKKLQYLLEFSHLNDTTLNQAVLIVKPNGNKTISKFLSYRMCIISSYRLILCCVVL
ncbi:unnamed protein product, partial [Adineta steineri]